eukprot:5339466-Amphidinium_carterae.1
MRKLGKSLILAAEGKLTSRANAVAFENTLGYHLLLDNGCCGTSPMRTLLSVTSPKMTIHINT